MLGGDLRSSVRRETAWPCVTIRQVCVVAMAWLPHDVKVFFPPSYLLPLVRYAVHRSIHMAIDMGALSLKAARHHCLFRDHECHGLRDDVDGRSWWAVYYL